MHPSPTSTAINSWRTVFHFYFFFLISCLQIFKEKKKKSLCKFASSEKILNCELNKKQKSLCEFLQGFTLFRPTWSIFIDEYYNVNNENINI